MNKLPFLISIPHGGREIPIEIQSDVCITEKDLFDDSDSFTQEIYNAEDIVEYHIVCNIARAFVDMSRSKDQLPPDFSDGLIKSATCYNKQIYYSDRQPNKITIEKLISKYYDTYHKKIEDNLKSDNIILALDCHSMAVIGPEISPDKGKPRPMVNLGDAEGKACNPKITTLLKHNFMDVFGFNDFEVSINKPFKGGYITRKYGNNPKPWIQIELNRKLYLSTELFDYSKLKMKTNKLNELNTKFREVLKLFYQSITQKSRT